MPLIHPMSQRGNMYLQNSSLFRTLPPPPPPPPAWHHGRRPNIPPLMKSAQWNYAAGLDAHAYPSPPMTTSPTSPKRSQFTEDRPHPSSVHEASSITSAPAAEARRTTFMASQILPAPTGPPPHFVFGGQHPIPTYGERPDLHSRPRAQSIPSYAGAYQSTAYLQPTVMGVQPHAVQLAPTLGGPVSMGAPVVGRIPRTGSRRAKAHVARACQNCKKAHLSCDEARPCARCVATRKESTCIDVEHKKRGRPRIQPERGQPARPLLTQTGPLVTTSTQAASAAEPYRLLRSQDTRRGSLPVGPSGYPIGLSPRLLHGNQSSSSEVMAFQGAGHPEPPRWRTDQPPLVAFLNLDLKIIKAMEPLRQLLAQNGELAGHNLDSYIDPRHREPLRHLQTQLREERMRREPTYLPAIGPHDEQAAQHLAEADVERITQGSLDRIDTWAFILPNGQTEKFYSRVRLARTSSYFAVLELQRMTTTVAHSSNPSGRPHDLGPSHTYVNPHTARDAMFAPPGPPSPFARSAPASPFSSLPQHLMTSLPASTTSSLVQSAHPAVSPNRDLGFGTGGYFPHHVGASSATGPVPPPSTAASMQPPPQPTSSIQRSNTTREGWRPDPLVNVQLPPIVSTSAPTTPVGATFFDPQNTTPQQSTTPGMTSTPQQGPGSLRRSSPNDRAEDEDTARKRRRLNIGEIIEK